jgi:translation initiation factor IF-2
VPHRKKHHTIKHEKHPPGRHDTAAPAAAGVSPVTAAGGPHDLELVVKCDSSGSLEAVTTSIGTISSEGVEVKIIQTGIGDVHKADIMQAESGSRLIIGFNVQVTSHVEEMAAANGIEVRLYTVIYRLIEDITRIAASLLPHEPKEEILGTAKVIRLFKSSRKGIILGLEVLKGELRVGNRFRVITVMGPVYDNRIESLQIEKRSINIATKHQQVGLKIRDFKQVAINDLVESYRLPKVRHGSAWTAKPGVGRY